MANFDFDQAEGLRRMIGGPKPRIFTFLSATPDDEKGAILVNLCASLTRAGSDVLLLDACVGPHGMASRPDAMQGATLVEAARGERSLDDVIQPMPQGFGVATLARGSERTHLRDPRLAERLADALEMLSSRVDIVVVDAELGENELFPIATLKNSEIVVQVSSSPESITSAYSIIKRLNTELGRRPCNVLVTGASEQEAQVVYRNIAVAANRYLALKLSSLGSVPADEHLKRAASLGRAVVDAFPLAGASVAFRRLAEKFALPDIAAGGLRSVAANGAHLVS